MSSFTCPYIHFIEPLPAALADRTMNVGNPLPSQSHDEPAFCSLQYFIPRQRHSAVNSRGLMKRPQRVRKMGKPVFREREMDEVATERMGRKQHLASRDENKS